MQLLLSSSDRWHLAHVLSVALEGTAHLPPRALGGEVHGHFLRPKVARGTCRAERDRERGGVSDWDRRTLQTDEIDEIDRCDR